MLLEPTPMPTMDEAMIQLNEVFKSMVRAGFEREDARALIAMMMQNAVDRAGQDGA